MSTSTIRLNSKFEVLMSSSGFTCHASVTEEVDNLWQQALTAGGNKLFDGEVLCTKDVSSDKVECFRVPYRLFYVQRISERVKQALNLCLLAVSGLIVYKNQVVLGKRSTKVTQYPGFWELAPAGSINAPLAGVRIDYRKQLADELLEELGVEPQNISSIEPLALVLDAAESTYDICCRINIDDSKQIEFHSSEEYPQVESIEIARLLDFIRVHDQELVPISKAMLKLVSVDFL